MAKERKSGLGKGAFGEVDMEAIGLEEVKELGEVG